MSSGHDILDGDILDGDIRNDDEGCHVQQSLSVFLCGWRWIRDSEGPQPARPCAVGGSSTLGMFSDRSHSACAVPSAADAFRRGDTPPAARRAAQAASISRSTPAAVRSHCVAAVAVTVGINLRRTEHVFLLLL